MNRRWMGLAMTVSGLLLFGSATALGQNTGQGGAGMSGVNRTGSQAAGAASSVSAAQGYGLDSRFTGSGFNRFTTGSAAMGTTTAGAGAATSGAFGQSAQGGMSGGGGFGNSGRMGGVGGMGGMGSMGMFGMGRNSMFGGMGMQQQMNQGNKTLRTRRRLGFEQPLANPTVIHANYNHVIKRVLDRGDYGKGEITVSMEGSTAVLRGTVESAHARDVAERLAMLEPGIAEVRNELIVRPAEPKPETVPTPTAAGQPR